MDSRRDVVHLRLRIEDGNDAEFISRWADTGLWATPLYYADALARWPRRFAALVRHVAHAPPGGVLVHCGQGRDRTGLASCVLLALAGVAPADIAADHALSAARLVPRAPACGEQHRQMMDTANTTVEAVATDLLAGIDLQDGLCTAGLLQSDLAALRRRLTTAG